MAKAKTFFRKWVDEYGGIEKLAFHLNVTSDAVRYWCDRKGPPKFANALEIIRLSKGIFSSYEDIVEATRPVKKRK